MQSEKMNTGIWIDQEQAILVMLDREGHHLHTIFSDAEDPRCLGNIPFNRPPVRAGACHERTQKNRVTENVKYYRQIMKAVEQADFIYIFGTADATLALQQEIEADKSFTPLIAGIETSERLTENQLIARVRDFFVTYLQSFTTS